METTSPSREFTIPYTLEEVKTAIIRTSGVHNSMKLRYSNIDSNPMLGMYKYSTLLGELATGMSNGNIWLNLQDLGSETKITISGVVSGNYPNGPYKLTEHQDYILKLITQELQGTFDSQAELEKNSGCLGMVVILIITSLLAYIL